MPTHCGGRRHKFLEFILSARKGMDRNRTRAAGTQAARNRPAWEAAGVVMDVVLPPSLVIPLTPPLTTPSFACAWSMNRKQRNRQQHAYKGNAVRAK